MRLLNKFSKLKKYEKEDFILNNNFNELDLFVAANEPDEEQFHYLIDVYLGKELIIKNQVEQAVKYLMKAKDIILGKK